MLHELIAQDLLLLERAHIRLAPGLNVLTGETGAGKTMLAHAIDLLLGGKARSGIVRPGAREAYVEGVFGMPPAVRAQLPDELAERLPEGEDEVVLARRVWPDGRTRAYIGGRSATVGDLRELGGRLVSFYGQHEHRRLMLSAAQLEILDAYCGPDQAERRRRMATLHARAREAAARIAELSELAGARERELDLLAYELAEIEAAAPSAAEADELIRERDRLRHQESLRDAAASGAEAIAPDSDSDPGGGASELLAAAARRIEPLAGVDPALGALGERLATLAYEVQDAGAELRRYALGLESSPGRLEEVEDRLAHLARLERKYGGSIASVLGHAETCRRRREELEGAEIALERGEADLVRAAAERDALAAELSAARRKAAPRLANAVRERLSALAMADAVFRVDVRPRDGGCGPRGTDAVELLIAPNAGVPEAPLRESASGGELSRIMLALLSAAAGGAGSATGAGSAAGAGTRGAAGTRGGAERDHAPLLVFDEIDAGIGGHTARAVGEHLKALAEMRQLLCITHLPQVAAHGDRHFRIEKSSAGGTATTTVTELAGDGVVSEIVRMLGAREDDDAASRHARQLLRAA